MRFRLIDTIGFVTLSAIGTTAWPLLIGLLSGEPFTREAPRSLGQISVAGAVIGSILYAIYILCRRETQPTSEQEGGLPRQNQN